MGADLLLEKIRSLWSEVLELPLAAITADSHFLLLGGDSLQLLRLLSRLRERLGVDLEPAALVDFATPARMAACCRQAAVPVLPVRPGNAVDAIPLHAVPLSVPATPVQQGIWLAEQLAAPASLYTAAVLLHLQGELDPAALQAACAALLQVFPVLRTRPQLDRASGSLLLVPCDADQDASVLVHANCEVRELPARVAAAVQVSLLSGAGPLCRMQLFRLEPGRHALLLAFHHLVSDGWSGSVLLAQLASLYTQLHSGSVPRLRADLRAFEHSRRVAATPSTATPGLLHWWQQHLAGSEGSQAWLWRQGDNCTWPHVLAESTSLVPAALVLALRTYTAGLGHSLFIPFLYAVRRALALSGDHLQPVLLLPVAQRAAQDERSVGCFVDVQLFAAPLSQGCKVHDILRQEAAAFAAARARYVPLGSLAAALHPPLLPDGNPWTSVLFAFQNFPRGNAVWPGLQHRVERVPAHIGQHALTIEVLPQGGDWQLRIAGAAALLSPRQLSQLHAAILASLEALCAAQPPG